MPAEIRFRAMGSDCHVVVLGSVALCDVARSRIDQLEQRWSRFLPSSEVSALNSSPGIPTIVSRETFELIARAVDGWIVTGGRFDPTVLGSVIDAGYHTTFELLATTPSPPKGSGLRVGCGRIVLDPVTRCVTIPPEVGFDPGGIGKGLAADIVAEELIGAGASGALVNIGGDLRTTGEPPDEGWTIAVEHPLGFPAPGIVLDNGAVATSARTKRAWHHDGTTRHHLIDPRTGRSVSCGLAGVTVVADEAWRAEVWAKAAFVSGNEWARSLLIDADLEGLIFADDGTTLGTPAFENEGAS